MLTGILFALFAGLTLGLYALPEKFTKDFEFANTWGLFFGINMLIVPPLAAFLFVDGLGEIIASIPSTVLWGMGISGLLWGIGVMMWGKAINYVGLSLGFSIFIGTVILVGSLIPFGVNGLPENNVFITILVGILVVLLGVLFNGKAGMLREKDDTSGKSKNVLAGIIIAIIGGLLATGFSYANAVGGEVISAASEVQGNASWVASVVIMLIIYMAGALFVIPYFIIQLSKKNLWIKFSTNFFGKNILMATVMAVLNFIAGVAFAYSAFLLGKLGGTVGYAIFNALSVAVAITSGLVMGEWKNAPSKARNYLYMGLAAMVLGVVVIAVGNSL
ncbi:L-rhamnose/proton symporter RhaT [Arcticibacterium luteifluviistationis]|uniref:Rhamnose/proton symporter RhaT n=1 Tax=Arcticibacterium luteifluviistationis TaxID=1784714 RepID=A0A2Z4G6G3_9BACT|nr:L-rhamnose/proton symporter RhaT [Arcticibacterium luteifluviistationis]AWV96729.1 rhamnose/proton symporter RhaT [Arcticibacterium luteifluviistationis]